MPSLARRPEAYRHSRTASISARNEMCERTRSARNEHSHMDSRGTCVPGMCAFAMLALLSWVADQWCSLIPPQVCSSLASLYCAAVLLFDVLAAEQQVCACDTLTMATTHHDMLARDPRPLFGPSFFRLAPIWLLLRTWSPGMPATRHLRRVCILRNDPSTRTCDSTCAHLVPTLRDGEVSTARWVERAAKCLLVQMLISNADIASPGPQRARTVPRRLILIVASPVTHVS